jgi:hypothetical protein
MQVQNDMMLAVRTPEKPGQKGQWSDAYQVASLKSRLASAENYIIK